jgi:hypothetical protein
MRTYPREVIWAPPGRCAIITQIFAEDRPCSAAAACFPRRPRSPSPPAAQAQQAYPNRPIRLLIGFAPGGSTDVVARVMSGKLQSLLGQSIVIENRPGAGGNIATEQVSRATPDGYVLLLGTIGALAINPTLYRDLSFDPLRDLTPISRIGTVLNVLAVPVDRPWRSVAELIAAAKARPDTLTCASSGVGGAGHLANQQLNMLAGIRTVHVPYRGGGALLADLVSGKVDYAFTTALNAVPQARTASCGSSPCPTPSAAACCRTCRPWPRAACRASRWSTGSRSWARATCRSRSSAPSRGHPCHADRPGSGGAARRAAASRCIPPRRRNCRSSCATRRRNGRRSCGRPAPCRIRAASVRKGSTAPGRPRYRRRAAAAA